MSLEELYKIIVARRKQLPYNSYVASLFQAGEDQIMQKVGEEAVEVVIAAKDRNRNKVIAEVADLWFHTLILLVWLDIRLADILTELERRKKGAS